jgi:hypothetical protein
MRLILPALATLLTVSALPADPPDPGTTGVWIESTDGSNYIENLIWTINLDGTFVEQLQHTPFNGIIDLEDTNSNVATNPGTITASNGQLTVVYSNNPSASGTYVLSDDQSKMIVKLDNVKNAFLFLQYGTVSGDGSMNIHMATSGSGVEALLSTSPNPVNMRNSGPAHWVEPGLAGIWVNNGPTAAQPNVQADIWVIQPDGPSTLHTQNVTATQPMDPNSSAHDNSTLTGFVDAFSGRFCFTNSSSTSRTTGIYALKGDELDITFDPNNQGTAIFKRVGYFNMDGTGHLR